VSAGNFCLPHLPFGYERAGEGKMSANLIGIIVILCLMLLIVAAVGIGIYVIYRKVHNTVTSYSRTIFGTDDPIEGFKKVEMEQSVTPKSVSSATSLYLPQIMNDFPEFHYDEMKTRAENVLVSYLRSVDANNTSLLTEGMEELKESLKKYVPERHLPQIVKMGDQSISKRKGALQRGAAVFRGIYTLCGESRSYHRGQK